MILKGSNIPGQAYQTTGAMSVLRWCFASHKILKRGATRSIGLVASSYALYRGKKSMRVGMIGLGKTEDVPLYCPLYHSERSRIRQSQANLNPQHIWRVFAGRNYYIVPNNWTSPSEASRKIEVSTPSTLIGTSANDYTSLSVCGMLWGEWYYFDGLEVWLRRHFAGQDEGSTLPECRILVHWSLEDRGSD